MTLKTHYSCAELAAFRLAGFPTTERGWRGVVERDALTVVELKGSGGRGGIRREYLPTAAMAKLIDRAEGLRARGESAARQVAVVEAFIQEEKAAEAARQAKGEAALADLVGKLTPTQHARFDARLAIVQGFEIWFVQAQPIGKKAGLTVFAEAYNANELRLAQITAAVREAFPTVSARSVERFVTDYTREGLAGLIDKQDGRLLKDVNVFTKQPDLYNATLALITAKPHIKTSDLVEMLKGAAVDAESGEVLFEAPSYWATERFVKNWRAKHPELFLAMTNPDEWKNRCMSAVGNASEDVERLNQRWEMDATPADWMLLDPEDGKKRRFTCSVVIDVYSRRMIVVLSRTPKAQTHMFCLRLALLAWGVPEEIVTDNGKDYVAREFVQVLDALGIKHHKTAPFSPWQKPHVERGIGVMLHSILELLPNFIGHSVAERSAIEARRTFSERLFKKNDADQVIDLDMAPQELQATINDWLAGTYEQSAHGETNEAPFARAAAWRGRVRRIQDERALDILLLPAAGGGTRTLQKKGIQLDGGWYAAPALFAHVEVGTEVTLRETEDFGELVVYQEGKFVCVAICPERKGVSRKELANHCRNAQAKRVKDTKRTLKAASKIDADYELKRMLQGKAQAAGKLATLPVRAETHTSHGLEQAAIAHRRLAGELAPAPIPADLQAAMDRRAQPAAAAPAPAPQTNVVVIPETPELRFRKWLEVNATVERGEVIDEPKLQKWWGMYQQAPEFKTQMRRHQAQNETGAPAATVTPVQLQQLGA